MTCNLVIKCLGDICSCEEVDVMDIENDIYLLKFDFNGRQNCHVIDVDSGLLVISGEWFNENTKGVIFQLFLQDTGELYVDGEGYNAFKIGVKGCSECDENETT